MNLKIFNPSGAHKREIKGLDALKKHLPNDWYGYASFEMIGHDGGEIDLVIFTDDRLLVVEIKDWDGKIEDRERTWATSRREEKSPVITVKEKSKKLLSRLRVFLAQRYHVPYVDSCVLLTGKARRSDLSESSKQKTFDLDFFITIGSKEKFSKCFPDEVYPLDAPRNQFKEELDKFFASGRVRPLARTYGGYSAENDPCWVHPQQIYSEYFAEKTAPRGPRALLRKWDFSKLGEIDSAYYVSENREALALREENAIGYLLEARPELQKQNALLTFLRNEDQESITDSFFELYEVPSYLHRLKEVTRRFGADLKHDARVTIARLLLSHLAELHEIGVAHRDLGDHCIWVDIPSRVSLSGFATSSFPQQTTVSQIRETIRAGTERLPEDVLEHPSDNYRKDVFLLGVVVHQILFGVKPVRPEGFPIWKEPNDTSLSRFWQWFDRCLDMDPQKRFAHARAAFEDFQRCDGLKESISISEKDFIEFSQKWLPQPTPESKIIREDQAGLVFQRFESDGSIILVKVWADARFQNGNSIANSRLYEFLIRIRKLKGKGFLFHQEIVDFGLTKYGSYVALRWEDGATLNEYNFVNFENHQFLDLAIQIIASVAELHRAGLYHGDLKPSNILIRNASKDEKIVCLLDCIDFSPFGTDRRTPAFMPAEGEHASTASCDGHAIRKILNDLLEGSVPKVTGEFKRQLGQIFDGMQNPDCGNPDLEGALNELKGLAICEVQEEVLTQHEFEIFIDEISEEISISPDERGFPAQIFPINNSSDFVQLQITLPGRSILIQYDILQNEIQNIKHRESTLLDFFKALKYQSITIKNTIRLRPGKLESNQAVKHFFITNQIQSRSSNRTETPPEIVDGCKQEGETFEPLPVGVDELWQALLSAEASLLPEVVVTGEPRSHDAGKIVLVPIGDPKNPVDFNDHEDISIEVRIRDGEWRTYGKLINRESRRGLLAIRLDRDRKPPGINSVVRLQNKGSKSSFEIRSGAVNRILKGNSVCRDLGQYFLCKKQKPVLASRFVTHIDQLDCYNLNAEQRDALETSLRALPLSMIQGPPGTGKTSVISALVHYLATQYRSSRILIVSQSHEAIDHATEQIVKRFRQNGDEPSLVRIGKKESLSDKLISFHSESLQGEYRERFRLSFFDRISPIGRRLGLPEPFVRDLLTLRTRFLPLLRRFESETASPRASDNESSSARKWIERASQQFDPDFDPSCFSEVDIYDEVERRLANKYGETSFSAVRRLREAIDLAFEWVERLEPLGLLDRFYVASCQIVTGTCVGIGSWQLGIDREAFDCVIIDEAARCGPGDLAVACQVAEQVVLVGDHKQLPPFIDSSLASLVADELRCAKSVVEKSDFQRLFNSEYSKFAGRTLKIQYRMQGPIGSLVSDCFYPETGGLAPGRHTAADVYQQLPECFGKQVVWFDTGFSLEDSIGTSFVNRGEVDCVIDLLNELAQQDSVVDRLCQDAETQMLSAAIGIIAPYKSQTDEIEDRLWASSLPDTLKKTCKVGTVDSYQGKENPIIVFSAVRCNPQNRIGFVSSFERINVSLSRARERLLIVGSLDFWIKTGNDSPLGKVANYIQDHVSRGSEGFAIRR